MTTSERWEAWEQATPRQQMIIMAWFIGCCGDDFDKAIEHAKQQTAKKEAQA